MSNLVKIVVFIGIVFICLSLGIPFINFMLSSLVPAYIILVAKILLGIFAIWIAYKFTFEDSKKIPAQVTDITAQDNKKDSAYKPSRINIRVLIFFTVPGCVWIGIILFKEPLWHLWSGFPFLLWGFALGQVVMDHVNISNNKLRTFLIFVIGVVFMMLLSTSLTIALPLFWPQNRLDL